MSEGTSSQELSPHQQLQKQALAIKRTIIDAWISDFPQIPPTPESSSPTTAHPRRGCTSQVLQDRHLERRRGRYDASKEAYTLPRKLCRLRSYKPRGVMEEENTQPPRRSKRNLSPPRRLEPPEPSTRKKISESPIKRQRPAAKARGRGGKISQPRPQAGDNAPPIAASNYQETLGSILLNEETTLNTSAVESRASSPTRTRNDLESAVPKIICRMFTPGMAMREDVRSLRRKLMAAARPLPFSLKDTIYPLLDEWDQNDAYFDEFPRSKEQEDAIWTAVQEIFVDAQKCGERDKPESSWSHDIVRPLIRNALKYMPWQNRVEVDIIDSVGISPNNLVPKNAKGTKFQLKKVDCGLFLTPPAPFCAKIERKLIALPDNEQNINQTSAGFIKKLPLIASFELKRQTGIDLLVQLGIWSAALAERLGKLQGPGEKESGLMAMPVVTVVGHDWKVYYSYTTEDSERVLQGPDFLGSTTGFVGIYRIMKAIQIIAEYGVETYMPWFEQYILDSESGNCTDP